MPFSTLTKTFWVIGAGWRIYKPVRRQAIIWTIAVIFEIRPLEMNCSEIWIWILRYSFEKTIENMSAMILPDVPTVSTLSVTQYAGLTAHDAHICIQFWGVICSFTYQYSPMLPKTCYGGSVYNRSTFVQNYDMPTNSQQGIIWSKGIITSYLLISSIIILTQGCNVSSEIWLFLSH